MNHETVHGQRLFTFNSRHGISIYSTITQLRCQYLTITAISTLQEIAEDRKFENITQVWLGGDHYKWRQMRTNGVDEKYITGDASDREKFQKWAETLETGYR